MKETYTQNYTPLNKHTPTIIQVVKKVVQFSWKMPTVLNQKKNHISDISDIYFSSYGRSCTENSSKIVSLFGLQKWSYLKN